jgi:ABC-2 type transport system ATP-binding protein
VQSSAHDHLQNTLTSGSPGSTRPGDDLAVHATGLVSDFGDVRAVDAVDFDVRHGEILAVPGPNGAGETTVLSMLATLLPIDAEQAEIFGVDVRRRPHMVRQLIGVTGQLTRWTRTLTARENLWLFARLQGIVSAAARATAVRSSRPISRDGS